MSFKTKLDELTKKSAEFIDKSVKEIEETSQDVIGSAKSKMDKFKIETELKEKKALLGQTVYEYWTKDTYNVEEADKLCTEIKELEDRLKRIESIKKV